MENREENSEYDEYDKYLVSSGNFRKSKTVLQK
jgi:hypothetical protein